MSKKLRVLIVSSHEISLLRFRGNLISDLVGCGYDVAVAAPVFSAEVESSLGLLGAETFTFPISRIGNSIWSDFRSYRALSSLIERVQADLIFPYTIKPVIYASFAARKIGVPAIGLVNGLGYVFSGNSARQLLLRLLIMKVYRVAVAKNKAMVFQNKEDALYFQSQNLIGRNTEVLVVDGSGVDMSEFGWREPKEIESVKFAFVARLLVEKGILLYIESAKELKKKWPAAEFHIFGEPQPGHQNIDMTQIKKLDEAGVVHYHGRRSDIAEQLQGIDVIVSPSWYREGIPRSLLEALSIGLALIVTDTPGCRETVQHSVNGWIIPPQDQQALTDSMREALQNPGAIAEMSRSSRAIAEKRFDVKIVNKQLVDLVGRAVGVS